MVRCAFLINKTSRRCTFCTSRFVLFSENVQFTVFVKTFYKLSLNLLRCAFWISQYRLKAYDGTSKSGLDNQNVQIDDFNDNFTICNVRKPY